MSGQGPSWDHPLHVRWVKPGPGQGTEPLALPSHFSPVEQEEIRELVAQEIERIFPQLVQTLKAGMECMVKTLSEEDPVKLDLKLRAIGILPRDYPQLSMDQRPHMALLTLSRELGITPDETQDLLKELIALGYVARLDNFDLYRLTF